jgi:transcription-repair coupling factor (superfamily II helicase)
MSDVQRRAALPPLVPFLDAVRSGTRNLAFSGLRGGATPLAIAMALLELDGPAIVVVPDPAAARTILRDLKFFLGGDESEAAKRLMLYPALDVSPFESISPHNGLTARRIGALSRLLEPRGNVIVVVTIEALMEKAPPRSFISEQTLTVRVEDLIERDDFVLELAKAGYTSAPLTEDSGDFSVRGGIIDLFCPLHDWPLRIELDDIEVESLRFFDPSRQVSKKRIEKAEICPARAIALSAEAKARFASGVKELADTHGLPKSRRDQLTDQIEAGILFPGVEFFLPLFHESLSTVLDYLPKNGACFIFEPSLVEAAGDKFEEKLTKRHERARDAGKPCVDIEDLYLTFDQLESALESRRRIHLGLDAYTDDPTAGKFHLEVGGHEKLREEILNVAQAEEPLTPLVERIRKVLGAQGRCVLVCSTPSGADRMERMLERFEFEARAETDARFRDSLSRMPGTRKVPILLGELSAGFSLPNDRFQVICEEEIFGRKKRSEAVAKFRGEAIASFADISEDDPIVHQTHGVGFYRGLVQLEVLNVIGEYLHLEYARGDKLYLPVHRLSQVHRYVGAGSAPVVDRLGGLTWEKVKKKAKAAARKIAKELLALYAKRKSRPGFAFAQPDHSFSEFEATFPYDETPDQVTTIGDVVNDMTKVEPMDRLVCGDVGFGKTEIALRAACLAVLSGKQVAVLVPTTTLAFQHHQNFAERFRPFGANVEMLSRFSAPKNVKKTLEGLGNGRVDVVVGTHKLLGKKVKFKDLGLLVVDEEQLFGVVQKEQIKKLKEQVDVLSMTATPIPRTLNMALSGIRDLSVINTPPEDRLAIRTYVSTWDEDTLREAMNRELSRGGQVFFVHNRIKTIDGIADHVRRLAPKARIRIAHGQMDAETIENIMIDFSRHEIDVLVSTAIIGSGLDFPQANTIFVHRADILGLAQLYQLRGRVGRSKRRAYCYLIIPGEKAVTAQARKRLAVLRTFTELGSGYKVAVRDMEIRGAGNLLGGEQSGNITAVGFELFLELLETEVRRIKGEIVEIPMETEVTLAVPSYLPNDYVEQVSHRLSLYKRLADAADLDEVAELEFEIKDRFGLLPEPVENLIEVVRIKLAANKMSITSIESGPEAVTYTFDDKTPVRTSTLVELATAEANRFTLSPNGRLIEKTRDSKPADLIDIVKKTLQRLK